MSFFRKRKVDLTPEQRTAQLRDSAIEYIKTLDKIEKDKFFESVELIWQGYDKLLRVKTKDQKQEEKERRELDSLEDIETMAGKFLEN